MNNLLHIFFSVAICLIISSSRKHKHIDSSIVSIGNLDQNIFVGDSLIAHKNFFHSIIKEKGLILLNIKNENYLKKYLKFRNSETLYTSHKNILVKFINEKKDNAGNKKVNLYTFIGNKKIDSVQFYRNITGEYFGKYNCLSYFNPKTSKLWQIKYFPVNPTRGVKEIGVVSYTESSINSDGLIKLDAIHFLDESLDVEMEKYHLYY